MIGSGRGDPRIRHHNLRMILSSDCETRTSVSDPDSKRDLDWVELIAILV